MTAKFFSSHRPGVSFIEVLLFVGIFALIGAVMLPLLFTSTESRLRQQTITLVEDNGTQALQQMTRRIHNAERILLPALGSTGSVLALQTESGALFPTIFAIQTGAIIMIEGTSEQQITSDQVAVTDFVVTNTSSSTSAESVFVRFSITRTIRLQAPHTYDRLFELLVARFPDDNVTGNSCGCSVPICSSNLLTWNVCQQSTCTQLTRTVECP